MSRSKFFVWGGAVACLALATACADSSPALTPTTSSSTVATSNNDGSILKVTAPTPTSPANSATFDKGVRAATLTATAATAPFGSVALTHHFQLFKGGALVADAPGQSANGSTVTMATGDLDFSTTYTWRVRAESNGVPGPWSSTQSFTTGEVVQPRRDANAYGGKIPRSVIIDDLNATVFSVGAQHPGAVQASCLGSRNDISFPIEMLLVLRTQYDNRWGFNCIRGNCNDPAAKVLTYHWSPGPSEGSTDVYIFQVISGACALEVFDETAITFGSGTIGRYSLLPGSPFLQGASFVNLLNY
jgi:hypothetical protein